ncbi:MAG: tetratricopeptide repeat protein [Rhodobacteraceae bacterium]|nr:tetratricopeptide repeat protein [Paracoccaceae bacterium]
MFGRGHWFWLALLVFVDATSGAWAQPENTAGDPYSRAVELRLAGNFQEALDILQNALSVDPRNSDLWVQSGFCHLALGDETAAEDAFSRALSLSPDYVDASFGLAIIAYRRGRHEVALPLLEEVVREQPRNLEAIELLRAIERRPDRGGEGRYEEARNSGSRAPDTQSGVASKPIRIDLWSEYSWSHGPRKEWVNGGVALSGDLTSKFFGSVGLDRHVRGAASGTKLFVRGQAKIGEHAVSSLELAASKDAAYLPVAETRLDFTVRPQSSGEGLHLAEWSAGVSVADYSDQRIRSGRVGLSIDFPIGGLGFDLGTSFHDNLDLSVVGASLTIRSQTTKRTQIFIKLTEAPEISLDQALDVRGVSFGISYVSAAEKTFKLNIGEERRGNDRRSFVSFGVVVF